MVQKSPEPCSNNLLAVTVPEAARLTSLSLRKINYLIADGTIPSVKVGRRRLIRVADLEAFLDGAAA